MMVGKRPSKRSFWATLGITMLVVWGCLGVSALLFTAVLVIRDREAKRAAEPVATATPMAPLPGDTATPQHTRLAAVTATPVPATMPATRSATSTPLPLPTETPTRAPTATPFPTPTTTVAAVPGPIVLGTPTPIVCTDPSNLGGMTIVSGQRFDCTISEEYMNGLMQSAQENPCQSASIALDDGRFTLSCRMGFNLQATGVAEVENCRVNLRITGGTPGFTRVVQDMLNAQMALIPYNVVCVDQVTIDHGEMILAGHGR
jgi:hypothetical protein